MVLNARGLRRAATDTGPGNGTVDTAAGAEQHGADGSEIDLVALTTQQA
jgi:hypothetical protein